MISQRTTELAGDTLHALSRNMESLRREVEHLRRSVAAKRLRQWGEQAGHATSDAMHSGADLVRRRPYTTAGTVAGVLALIAVLWYAMRK